MSDELKRIQAEKRELSLMFTTFVTFNAFISGFLLGYGLKGLGWL